MADYHENLIARLNACKPCRVIIDEAIIELRRFDALLAIIHRYIDWDGDIDQFGDLINALVKAKFVEGGNNYRTLLDDARR